ncbi:hypothetical protein CDN99_27360 [Roseateles aquatilis]|uniref:Uncharacterized protein n=1 Tax=Roseateles aquatilis TaxID=431061 RepID=A0A2D0ALQ9_9BURK|nr:hypothetical protein [Roseateles aquatilis]OWQ83055.1 hypothetical protein CDN99_27360 [Roseateles aquatilis]
MTTATLNVSPQVMAADAARVRTANAAGERLVVAALHAGRSIVEFVHAAAEVRPRDGLRQTAADISAERPDLAFSLRRAARNGWMY